MKETLSKIFILLFVSLLSTACNAEVIAPPTATIIPTSTPPVFITATLPSTQIPYPSPTLEPAPTAVLVIDTTPLAENNVSTTEASSITSEPIPSVESTPNVATAPLDGDSVEFPAVNITLLEASILSFSHSSDLSSPEGDPDDWVRFTLGGEFGQEKIVSVVLDCSGSSKLNLELSQNGVPLQNWANIDCGRRHQFQLYLFVGAPYSLRLSPAQSNTALNYLSYTLTVQLTK